MKLSKSEISKRWRKYQQILVNKNIDGILLSSSQNIFYLTGYNFVREQDREAFVLITPKDIVLLIHRMYASQVKTLFPFLKLEIVNQSLFETLANSYQGKKIGIEEINITVFEAQFLEKKQIKLINISKDIATLRAIKTTKEIKVIKEIEQITKKALEHTRQWISPGVTEKMVAEHLEKLMIEFGAFDSSFPTIVASGINSGIPHHMTSNRIIQENDIVMIDCGGKKDGYCGDLTRTYVLGKPSRIYNDVYKIVLQAQKTALGQIKDGVKIADIDLAVRKIFEEAGLIDHYWHTTGHGLGIGIHEYPSLHFSVQGLLQRGMVITVEPGLYFDWGGIRIEDVVVVTKTGFTTLSNLNHEEIN